MAEKKLGKQTVKFAQGPYVIGAAAVGGQKEGEGPLKSWFDVILDDDTFGEKTWEKAESKILKEAMMLALQKSGKDKKDIDLVLSGDLLNQIMSSSFMARDLHLPFLGLYGACSTMTESLLLGSMLTDGGFAQNACGTRKPKTAFGTVDGNGGGFYAGFRKKSGFIESRHRR